MRTIPAREARRRLADLEQAAGALLEPLEELRDRYPSDDQQRATWAAEVYRVLTTTA